MSFSFHTECVAPSKYSGPFVGSGGMTAASTSLGCLRAEPLHRPRGPDRGACSECGPGSTRLAGSRSLDPPRQQKAARFERQFVQPDVIL